MGRLPKIVLAAALLVACGSARAQAQAPGQAGDDVARARTHFEAGRALYQLGNYTEAVREFAAGYQLAPRPQFLLNLGQCYRKLDDLTKAREMYQRYLRDAPASDPERAQAQAVLVEIDKQIAERPVAMVPPPATGPSAATTEPAHAVAPSASGSAAAASNTLTQAAPHKRSFIKRHWWIIPVSAAVVGVGVGLGVYYGTRSNPCDGANLACWDLSKPQ
ncbi:MAG: hypothetical protein JWN44_57 [Myxococcales bacterium]|nr:hypothetical protein [Myxococcales bacterium]